MEPAAALRTSQAQRGWSIARDPRRLVGIVLAIDAGAIAWAVLALTRLHSSARGWAVAGLLVALAVGYEELARRFGRLQLRVGASVNRDMTAVWIVAAAVALDAGLLVVVAVAVFGYVWFRRQHRAGEILYRRACTAAIAVLGGLSTHAVTQASAHAWDGARWLLPGALPVLVAIAVFGLVTRALSTVVLLALGMRGAALVGSHDDNLAELATLSLGGLVALAAVDAPWLCVLVVAPMISLHRGAFVRELETAATVDAKTGLLNAVAWEELTRRELARGRRDCHPVAVLIVDVDRFKLVNDRFGHLVGDDVLRQVGRCLEDSVRDRDTVGRFGGEEFVVVLPEANEIEAMVVAERLRSRINEVRVSAVTSVLDGVPDEPVSVSIGVACAPAAGAELADLLVAADAALYAAKAGGRNRVVLSEGGSGEFERAARG